MAHNAEAEACDLLMEIERLDLLDEYVDEDVYQRVCLYLTRYVMLVRFNLIDKMVYNYTLDTNQGPKLLHIYIHY